MEKSSTISLPELNNYTEEDLNNKTTITNLRNLLIEKATNVVNNTILKNYISKNEIKENIERYAKVIQGKEGIDYIGDPAYSWNTLYLSPYFFSEPIKTAHFQNNELHKYPELIKLLEIIGLTTVVSDTLEDTCFRIGTKNTKDVFIKSLIANYFATSYDKKDKREVNFAGIKFSSYGVSNSIQVNMIYTLASIIGEESLAEALISQETEKILKEKIDEITNKKGTGETFISNLKNLNYKSKTMMGTEGLLASDIEFYQSKMLPFIEMLKKENPKRQNFITSFLEESNYDIEDFNFHHGTLKDLDLNFSKDDIKKIKYYCERFSKHVEDCNNGGYSIVDYLYTETPQVSPRDGQYHADDFTFVNKVMTVIFIDEAYYNQSQNELKNSISNLINQFTEVIIPRSIKNKNLSQTPEEFTEMLSYLPYETDKINTSKKGQRQIKKLKKQINKKH